MSAVEFCPHCDVAMDLHDGEDSCEHAAYKVRILNLFYASVGLR